MARKETAQHHGFDDDKDDKPGAVRGAVERLGGEVAKVTREAGGKLWDGIERVAGTPNSRESKGEAGGGGKDTGGSKNLSGGFAPPPETAHRGVSRAHGGEPMGLGHSGGPGAGLRRGGD